MKGLVIALVVLFAVPCFAQDRYQLNTPSRYERYDSNAMSLWRNRYDPTPPKIYGADGQYLGRLSINPYVQDSIANPYNNYGSRHSPTSIQNPHSPYGGRYPAQPVYVQPRRW
jgi:hypothetical protein